MLNRETYTTIRYNNYIFVILHSDIKPYFNCSNSKSLYNGVLHKCSENLSFHLVISVSK
jgi:hypothetical protein